MQTKRDIFYIHFQTALPVIYSKSLLKKYTKKITTKFKTDFCMHNSARILFYIFKYSIRNSLSDRGSPSARGQCGFIIIFFSKPGFMAHRQVGQFAPSSHSIRQQTLVVRRFSLFVFLKCPHPADSRAIRWKYAKI